MFCLSVSEAPDLDFLDPNNWEEPEPCRIYDVDGERYVLVDAWLFPKLVTMPNVAPAKYEKSRSRFGALRPRRWFIRPPHPKKNGAKLYFVSNVGWREGRSPFLHVEVMRLAGVKPPSPRHKIVHHIDGNEWNCQLGNLEWATHVKNRRQSRQKYIRVPPLAKQ